MRVLENTLGKSRRWQKSPFLGVRVVDEVLHQAVVGRKVAGGGAANAVGVVGRPQFRRIHLVAPKLAISLTDTEGTHHPLCITFCQSKGTVPLPNQHIATFL